MRDMTVGVVAPAHVNVPPWVAQQRGFLERRGLGATERVLGTTHRVTSALRDGDADIGAPPRMIPYDDMATDAGFTNLGPVTEDFALNAVCISRLGERDWVTPFLRAPAEAAGWSRGHIKESAATAVDYSYLG